MKPLTPYLFFDGNAREVMEFYRSCFGGELQVLTYADAPEGTMCPDGETPPDPDKVMHACLSEGDFCIMASDNPMGAPNMGDHISLSITCESMEQIRKLFDALGENGEVIMPLDETFWARQFGIVLDKYGIHWMLNYPL